MSDTARNTTVNHHGVGAGAGVVVAPASEPGGSPDISRYSCSLIRLDPADGATEWRWPVPRDQCFLHALTKPAVADLDGDGSPEVVAAPDETVAILDPADGSELAAYEREVPVWTTVTPANLTADPGRELLGRYGDGRVVALAYE